MKKLLILIAIVTLPAFSFSSEPDSLTGVWQDSENLGSGWSNSFLFFGDGNYSFFANQMDCSKRLMSYSGKWKISGEEEAIFMTIDERVIIEGGRMEKADGSCASDSMLVGGVQKTVKVTPEENVDYAISKVYKDNASGIERKFIYIDAMKYWYFGDPVEMRIQFEGE
jgi:hypothetical protein